MAADPEAQPNEVASVAPGIQGWLLVFVIWLALLMPLYSIGLNVLLISRMESVYPEDAVLFRETGMDVRLWAVTALREALRVAAAVLLLLRRTPSSVWIAFAVLWAAGPLLIIATWTIFGGELLSLGLLRAALVALAWSLFLFLSQRVKVTYGFRSREE